jgi:hypothetical protein
VSSFVSDPTIRTIVGDVQRPTPPRSGCEGVRLLWSLDPPWAMVEERGSWVGRRTMIATTLPEIEESLRVLDTETLREMMTGLARSHREVCELTSRIGGCAHTDPGELRDRIDRLSVDELVERIAPMIWPALDLHRRIGG